MRERRERGGRERERDGVEKRETMIVITILTNLINNS